MFLQIEFKHFFNEKNFCELQRSFANMDSKKRYENELWTEPRNELKITHNFIFLDEEQREIELERDFYDDFIIPQMDGLALEHIDIVKNYWKSQNIWSKEDRIGFSEEVMAMLRRGRIEMKSSDYLPINIRESLAIQLDEFEELLDNLVNAQDTELNPKLAFNWIRADVECFFYLLRKNNQIKCLSDAQLGKIIDNLCECLPGVNNGNYIKIKDSRKHLNNLKNGDRLPDESIKRLKRVFEENFFKE